jgi:26S proteasome regulatory subunit N1
LSQFNHINEYYLQAGNLLAMGICSSGIQDQVDPAAALLLDYVNSDTAVLRVGSILG